MKLSASKIAAIDRGLSSKVEKTRWKSAIALGEYCKSDPKNVWPLIVKYGSSRKTDTRTAIATCVLEHILEYHFDPYFGESLKIVRGGDIRFGRTLAICWKFGQALKKNNSSRFDRFKKRFSQMAAA